MNIALLTESLDGGGAERVVQRLALGLAQRGARVLVYCLRKAGPAGGSLQAAGVTVREAQSIGRDPRLTWQLGGWLRRDRVDVAHAHSCAALVRVFPAARLLGIPLLHVWHGWPLEPPTRYHRLAVLLDRWVARVGVNSESLRSRLPTTRAARTAAYLPNGLDLPSVMLAEARRELEALCGRPCDGPIVLSVANLRIEKDICGLLAAFASLRREWPHAHLICLGAVRDVAYGRAVQQTTAGLSLQEHVHFPGPVCDAWKLMAGADVFSLSSRTESMPNVILEAMSQRVPIVATAVGDVGCLDAPSEDGPWLLRHNESGLLAPPADPVKLAAALAAVLRDPATARKRADRAFDDYRRRFTTDQMVRRYEQVYDEMRRPQAQPRPATKPPRRCVLMLGPAPPQIGGMVTSINLLMKSPLGERYAVCRCASPMPRSVVCCDVRHSALRRWCGHLPAVGRHLAALARLGTMLIQNRVDLLHVHTCSYLTYYRNLLDLAVAKSLGRAVVLHIRGGQFEQFCRGAGRWEQWVIRRGLAAADAIVVMSERWQDALRPYAGPTPVYVIPNAVEPPELAGPTSANGHACRFLYLARLTPAKGLGDLISASAQLRSEGVPFELLIAGPVTEELQPFWEDRVRASGLATVSTFTGPVSGRAKTRLLRSADCFVHPSHSEALPNAVLEAAAAGLPVIATAVGSLPEALAAGGDSQPLCPLVAPHDATGLAREMKRLAADAALRRRMGAALRQHVTTHYSLERVAERLGRVYEHVLRRSGRRATARRRMTQS